MTALRLYGLNAILVRSLTIDERIALRLLGPATSDPEIVRERIERWRSSCATVDQCLLHERLLAEGVDLDCVEGLATERHPDPNDPLPAWAGHATWICGSLTSECDLPPPEDQRPALPFQDAFFKLAQDASRRTSLFRAGDILTLAAVNDLVYLLLSRATTIFARPLLEGFSLFRDFGSTEYRNEDHADLLYQQYIKTLRDGEILDALTHRPVLLRLLCLTVSQWIEVVEELLARLRNDHMALCHEFNEGNSLGQITKIEGGLSDRHNNGREVLRITFSCGEQVCYKPKDLGVDLALAGFLKWLQENGSPNSFEVACTLPRDSYGWAKWIYHKSCASLLEVEQFYRRAGSMMCVLHLCGGTDFHAENIIANGDTPVVVDVETLFHPWTHPSTPHSPTSATQVAARTLRASVLATHYLSVWIVRPDGVSVRAGGLDAFEAHGGIYTPPFEDINTDKMRCADSYFQRRGKCPNLPTLGAEICGADMFMEDVVSGYESMYRFISSKRDEMRHHPNAFQRFIGCKTRVILRPTQLYGMVVDQAMREDLLCSGFLWSTRFERLAEIPASRNPSSPSDWSRVRAERVSLASLDVPYFHTYTNGRELFLQTNESIGEPFDESAYDRQLCYLSKLGERDLAHQVRLIRGALGVKRSWYLKEYESAGTNDCLSKQQGIEVAESLAKIIDESAMSYDGASAWLGRIFFAKAGTANALEVSGHGLYNGGLGIAVFLAALHSVTGCHRTLQLARSAINALPSSRESQFELAREIGIGGATGVGSLVYALTRLAGLLSQPDLLSVALDWSRFITSLSIRNDKNFDVVSGAAGAALALISLYSETGDESTLQRALLCCDHLMAAQQKMPHGGGAWVTQSGAEMPGMSHGASGITVALLRMFRLTRDMKLLSAACLALEFEATIFDPSASNWPVCFQHDGEPAYPVQWCYGSSGIGLARLEGIGLLDSLSLDADIAAAVRSTLSAKPLENDDLCCDNFGRVDFLLTAGTRLKNESLERESQRRARLIVDRAALMGGFGLRSGDGFDNPGFHTGLSGIGYQVLRMIDPKSFPSILLWE